MGDQQRLSIFPTQMNLTLTKNSLMSAKNGHRLLKRKADALKFHHQKLKEELDNQTFNLKEEVIAAHMALGEAEFQCPDIRMFVHHCSQNPIDIKLTTEQIAGIDLSKFYIEKQNVNSIVSLGRGGLTLIEARGKFMALLEKLIYYSSVKVSFDKIDSVFSTANRRVNALENIILPRLENTISYISEELDEQAREEFYRLKRVVNKKKK